MIFLHFRLGVHGGSGTLKLQLQLQLQLKDSEISHTPAVAVELAIRNLKPVSAFIMDEAQYSAG